MAEAEGTVSRPIPFARKRVAAAPVDEPQISQCEQERLDEVSRAIAALGQPRSLSSLAVSDQWSKYAWRDEELNDDLMSGCLGVVVGVEEAKVRELLAVDEGSRRNATVHDAWRLSESDFGNDLVQISSIGHAIVTFEPNGWHGVGYELAAALSRNGRYAAYFWNVNALMQFVFAEAGEVKRDFDPLLYDNDGARGEGPARRDGSPIAPVRRRATDSRAGELGAHRAADRHRDHPRVVARRAARDLPGRPGVAADSHSFLPTPGLGGNVCRLRCVCGWYGGSDRGCALHSPCLTSSERSRSTATLSGSSNSPIGARMTAG